MKRWQSGIVLVLLCALSCIYFLAVGPYWDIDPDSSFYIESAENLAAFRGYGNSLRPPVTSLLYAIPLYFSQSNYVLLNGLNAVFSILATSATIYLFRIYLSLWAALWIGILLLGSNLLLLTSTAMLSDVFYLFFSVLALGVYSSPGSGRVSPATAALVGFAAALASLTRSVGLALILAILAHQTAMLFSSKTRHLVQPWLFVSVGAALAATVGWELRNYNSSVSMFDLALQKQIWVPSEGYVAWTDMARRFAGNVPGYRWIGDIVLNQHQDMRPVLSGPLRTALTMASVGVCLYGYAVRCWNDLSALELYTVIYLTAIALFENAIYLRWFLPITPFLIYYFVAGCQELSLKLENRTLIYGSIVIRAIVVLYLGMFLGSTFLYGRFLIRETHYSELAPYPIKYDSNYDLQRLALWFSDWAEPRESYLCVHHRVLARFTRQKASTIPFSADPERLFERLRQTGSRYVFANLREDVVKLYLLPAIAARPDRFEVLREEPLAILYRYAPDGAEFDR